MANSTAVSDSQTALAAQYNNLRQDVLNETTGHKHDGTSGGGRKVDHSDLVDDAAISGTYLTHAIINNHVQGSGTSTTPDADGGDAGVHGLAAAAQVAGAVGTVQWVIQAGSAALDESGNSQKVVTFTGAGGAPFTSTPIVVACYASAPTVASVPPTVATAIYVHSITTSQFTAQTPRPDVWGGKTFHWIAVGAKTS